MGPGGPGDRRPRVSPAGGPGSFPLVPKRPEGTAGLGAGEAGWETCLKFLGWRVAAGKSAPAETRSHWAVTLARPLPRLAALEAQVARLQEERAQRERQVHVRRARNVAQRAAYEALRLQARLREAALRRLEDEARDLLERMVQRKARAAAERNLRNERRERSERCVPSPIGEPLPPPPFPGEAGPRTLGKGAAPRACIPGSFYAPQGQAGAGVPGAEEGCQADSEH